MFAPVLQLPKKEDNMQGFILGSVAMGLLCFVVWALTKRREDKRANEALEALSACNTTTRQFLDKTHDTPTVRAPERVALYSVHVAFKDVAVQVASARRPDSGWTVLSALARKVQEATAAHLAETEERTDDSIVPPAIQPEDEQHS
jgi:hypothetical protein